MRGQNPGQDTLRFLVAGEGLLGVPQEHLDHVHLVLLELHDQLAAGEGVALHPARGVLVRVIHLRLLHGFCRILLGLVVDLLRGHPAFLLQPLGLQTVRCKGGTDTVRRFELSCRPVGHFDHAVVLAGFLAARTERNVVVHQDVQLPEVSDILQRFLLVFLQQLAIQLDLEAVHQARVFAGLADQ